MLFHVFLFLAGPLPNIFTVSGSPGIGVTSDGAAEDRALVTPAPAAPHGTDAPTVAASTDAVPNGNLTANTNGAAKVNNMQQVTEAVEHANGHLGTDPNLHDRQTDAAASDSESNLSSPKARSQGSDDASVVNIKASSVLANGSAADTTQRAYQNEHSSTALHGVATSQEDSEVDDQQSQPTKRSKQHADLCPAQSGYAAQSGYGASDDDPEFSDMDAGADETDADAQPEADTEDMVADQLPKLAHDNSHVPHPPHAVGNHTANMANAMSIDLPLPPVPVTVMGTSKANGSINTTEVAVAGVTSIKPFQAANGGTSFTQLSQPAPDTAMPGYAQMRSRGSGLEEYVAMEDSPKAAHLPKQTFAGPRQNTGAQEGVPAIEGNGKRNLEGWKVCAASACVTLLLWHVALLLLCHVLLPWYVTILWFVSLLWFAVLCLLCCCC